MKSQALRTYLKAPHKLIHARLARTKGNVAGDTVEFDVEVDLPQRPVYPVKSVERVRVRFPAGDTAPEVFVLRDDFPFVPHLVQREAEFPRQLCLYERPWADERPNWAPGPFVERIRRWLAGTADGTLHRPDQPLEPVLLQSPFRLILPPAAATPEKICWIEHYHIGRRGKPPERVYFIAFREAPPETDLLRMPVLFVKGPAVVHGVVRQFPRTLGDLETIVRALGGSLVNAIAAELSGVLAELKGVPFAKQNLIVVLRLPKQREADGPIETYEHQAFLFDAPIEQLLQFDVEQVQKGGIWVPEKRERIRNPKTLATVKLLPMSVGWSLQPELAAAMNGQRFSVAKIVALGLGALGSQVVNNLWRSGFGVWTLVDDDFFEPHNGARHLLPSNAVGWQKVAAVSQYLREVFPGRTAPTAIACDYLAPKADGAKLDEAITAADLVLDFSASVSVGRQLAVDPRTRARRASVFLNQRGDELIILVEDAERKINLVWLEAEYMRAVATDEKLDGHFDSIAAVAHRYGNGCRELSAVVPQDSMALFAGLAAARIKTNVEAPVASATVFRFDRKTGAIGPITVPTSNPIVHVLDGWTILLHPEVASVATKLRAENLPVETGGVLLGLVDRVQRYVAIVALLPAPPDSQQWPTSFIRGSQGLLEAVNGFSRRTLGNVIYVGEWHSHPRGHDARPSGTDWEAVALCSPFMESDALPTLMLIVGEDRQLGFAFKPLGQNRGIDIQFLT